MTATARIAWEPETASGGRTSWARTVTALSPGKGAKSYDGEYLRAGVEVDLPVGMLVLEVVPTGSVKTNGLQAWLWRVGVDSDGDGVLKRIPGEWDWRREQLSLRDRVAELLAEAAPPAEVAPSEDSIDLSSVRAVLLDQLDLLRVDLRAWPAPEAKQRIAAMRELFCNGLGRVS